MSRDWTLYLGDIADACRLIEEFTAGMSGESFAGTAGDATWLTFALTPSANESLGVRPGGICRRFL